VVFDEDGNLVLNGTLDVNGGLLDVRGNLNIVPGGCLVMSSDEDVVTVQGNLVVNPLSGAALNRGLLDLKGDLVLNMPTTFATGDGLHAQFSGSPRQQHIHSLKKDIRYVGGREVWDVQMWSVDNPSLDIVGDSEPSIIDFGVVGSITE
jgi:hypothetical protein